jgi:uncharacterized protein (DUF2252 family)
MQEFVRMAHVIDGTPKIKDNPPLIFHHNEQNDHDWDERVRATVEGYRESLPLERRVLFDRYELVDTAIKVVGIGSVGTYCAVGLFFAAENDPLFLQVKEARTSVLEPHVAFAPYPTNGERVVFGQRLMQAASDIFLGHVEVGSGRDLYVRQLRDVKVKPMVEIFNPDNMHGYARNCGWALAQALPEAITEFAVQYAKQNEADHAALIEAIRDGVIEAITE